MHKVSFCKFSSVLFIYFAFLCDFVKHVFETVLTCNKFQRCYEHTVQWGLCGRTFLNFEVYANEAHHVTIPEARATYALSVMVVLYLHSEKSLKCAALIPCCCHGIQAAL